MYKGFKAGDKITITMVHDSNVTFTLTCTKADDENGASYNQATLTVNGCIASCDIKAPAGSTAFMLVGVVGSNKSATTKNVFGTAESPNVIKGGSITLGDTKVAMTAENFLTYALPWGTGKSVNANISSNTVWN